MIPPNSEPGPRVVMYVALRGVNIPGGIWLTEPEVHAALLQLPASMTYRRIVGRPDSILLSVSGTTTEENVRRAVSEAVGCRCVATSTALLSRIVEGAVATLRTLGTPVAPPYRITVEGAEWEWCLILSSDALPPGLPDGTWLFDPTPTVVAVTPLEGRALLARKRRFTPNGARITLGNRLLDPWQKVLDANGITVSCLTSRTLNRVAEVVEASASLAGVTMKPMAPTPDRAAVVVGTFDPALVFPLTDPMTVPLLRLMLATDDVGHASMLFVMADHQERETTGTQRAIHGGQMWYGFRLLCSHLRESGNALTTLVNSVADRRLQDLLDGRPDATAALERLRVAFGPDAFITKVRDSIGSHYQQADIKRVYERDLEAGRVDGSLIACQVGGLSRFTITDVLALRLMDEAAGEDLATGGEEFAKRGEGVVALAADLSTFVGHLVDALLNQQGFQVTHDTIEVPALLRAAYDAYDALEKARQA